MRGFPLNYGPWSPHNNPLGKGGPARGPWVDFDDEPLKDAEEPFEEPSEAQEEPLPVEAQEELPVAPALVGSPERSVLL